MLCEHCQSPKESFDEKAREELHAPPGCWFCDTCSFAANTVGYDLKCQVCMADGGAAAAGMPQLWRCPSCQYWNTGDDGLRACDYCDARKPPQWELDMLAEDER